MVLGAADELRKQCGLQPLDLPLKSGQTYSWGILDLAKLLQYYCKHCDFYREMVAYALDRTPAGVPLRLVLYEDEIIPGNIILGKRKMHAWYFTLREFDGFVRSEHGWICFALLQSSIVPLVEGEFSCVSRLINESICTMSTPSICQHGITVLDPPRLLRIQLYDLQDESALKYKWAIKGHGGLKPCMHCTNVIMKNHASRSLHEAFVDIADLRWEACHLATDEELWAAQDEMVALKEVRGKAAKLKLMEKASGQNCVPLGLLACKQLRPYVKPRRSSYDVQHCYYSGGIAEVEISLLVPRLLETGFKLEQISAFVNPADGWMPSAPVQLSADGVKGLATDVLRATVLLRHFLVKVVKPFGLLRKEIASFEALADVVQKLQELKLWCDITACQAAELRRLQALHFSAFKECYGNDSVRPKHHYSMHIPQQLEEVGLLLDAFPAERKHQLIIEIAEFYNKAKVTKLVELLVALRVNLVQLDEMQRSARRGELCGPETQVEATLTSIYTYMQQTQQVTPQ